MTGPHLAVDADALAATAREFAALGDGLTRNGTAHETSPAPDQPSGAAVSALIGSANHMAGVCASHLLGLAQSMAEAARFYASVDDTQAGKLSTTMPR